MFTDGGGIFLHRHFFTTWKVRELIAIHFAKHHEKKERERERERGEHNKTQNT
jgi:hypothetical protein